MVGHKASIRPRARTTVANVRDDDDGVVDRSSKGVLLGRDARWLGLVRRAASSTLVIGPTRSGKTSSIIVPNVLWRSHGAVGDVDQAGRDGDHGDGSVTQRQLPRSSIPQEGPSSSRASSASAGARSVGARSWEGALSTSAGMVAAAQRRSNARRAGRITGRSVPDALLSSLLHAAALGGDAAIGRGLRWVDRHQGHDALERLEAAAAPSTLPPRCCSASWRQTSESSQGSGRRHLACSAPIGRSAAIDATRQRAASILRSSSATRTRSSSARPVGSRRSSHLSSSGSWVTSKKLRTGEATREPAAARARRARQHRTSPGPPPARQRRRWPRSPHDRLPAGPVAGSRTLGPDRRRLPLALLDHPGPRRHRRSEDAGDAPRPLRCIVELARLSASESRDARGRRSRSISTSTTRQERLCFDTAARGRGPAMPSSSTPGTGSVGSS